MLHLLFHIHLSGYSSTTTLTPGFGSLVLMPEKEEFSLLWQRDVTFVFLLFSPDARHSPRLQGNVHIHTKLETNKPGSAPRPGMHTQTCANAPTHSKINWILTWLHPINLNFSLSCKAVSFMSPLAFTLWLYYKHDALEKWNRQKWRVKQGYGRKTQYKATL